MLLKNPPGTLLAEFALAHSWCRDLTGFLFDEFQEGRSQIGGHAANRAFTDRVMSQFGLVLGIFGMDIQPKPGDRKYVPTRVRQEDFVGVHEFF
jgi:hypothetical protein